MTSSAAKELHLYILDQCAGLDGISSIPMMGGYIYYIRGRIFGGMYGSGFLVKDVPAARRAMPDSVSQPPYEGARPMLPVTILDDRTRLQQMIAEMYNELPEPKPKKKHAKKTE